jgi:hypothetical protein
MSNIARMMQQATAGAGGAGLDVDEVFSTDLYTGNSSSKTITNGIDLSGEGGLIWTKNRDSGQNNVLQDSARGLNKLLYSNTTDAEASFGFNYAFASNGYSMNVANSMVNGSSNYVNWTFRKAANFFDVQKWGGNEVTARQISHNLGTVPGVVIIKKRDYDTNYHRWFFWHRSLDSGKFLTLNTSNAQTDNDGDLVYSGVFNSSPNASGIFLENQVNQNQYDYVAYFFGHNNSDGGFGPKGDQDIIKCDSYTGNASGTGPEINLGFEPQWLLVKNADNSSSDWLLLDVMRGWSAGDADFFLETNTNDAEQGSQNWVDITPNGFKITNSNGQINGLNQKHIYIAIRRGPLNTPTSGTDVFSTLAYTGNGQSSRAYDVGSNVCDMLHQRARANSSYIFPNISTRLVNEGHKTSHTNAKFTLSHRFDKQNGIRETGFENTRNQSSETFIMHSWSRAPGYFDIVNFTGNGSNRELDHNLGVTPEMMWVKCRSDFFNWCVYHKDLDASNPGTKYLFLNTTGGVGTTNELWNGGNYPEGPNKDTFRIGVNNNVNKNNETYIAFLFASASGVSKVGSVSHSFNSTTNVDCGFSSGARFVMVKSTASGAWRVWDSTRGIVAGNDPYFHWDDDDVEITNGDLIDPYSGGFTLSSNFYTDNYIFYAVA